MPAWLNALKKIFGNGDDAVSASKVAKDVVNGKGEVFNDNATHLKMFGGREVDVVPTHNGALLQVSGVGAKNEGGFSISMDKQEYAKFSALDESHQKKFVENYLQQYAPNRFKELNGNKNVAIYWSQVGDKKFYVPVTTAELNKLKSLSGQEKEAYFKELLKEKNPQQYNAMLKAEKALAADNKLRDVAQTPWQRNGSPTNSIGNQGAAAWQGKFKQYPDEPLNPRIGKVTPFVDANTVYLNMTVDGKDKTLTISNKNTVDAFHAGALPLNVLANKVLEMTDRLQVNLQSRFEMAMDEQRSQEQNQSMGLRVR